MKPFVRNPYNYDAEKVSNETGLKCEDESKCQQQFAEEADINYITDRFMRTGQLPQVINMPTSGDFAGTYDFQSSMNLIVQAKNEFMALPAKMRERFQHDPAKLIAFLEDESNDEEAYKLGLLDEEAITRRRTARTTAAPNTPQKPLSSTTEGNRPATVENPTT